MGINRHHFLDILPVSVEGVCTYPRGYVQTNLCSCVLEEGSECMIFVPLFLFWFKTIDCGERGHGEYFEKKGEHCLLETGNSILMEALGADMKGVDLSHSCLRFEVWGPGKSELRKVGVWGP